MNGKRRYGAGVADLAQAAAWHRQVDRAGRRGRPGRRGAGELPPSGQPAVGPAGARRGRRPGPAGAVAATGPTPAEIAAAAATWATCRRPCRRGPAGASCHSRRASTPRWRRRHRPRPRGPGHPPRRPRRPPTSPPGRPPQRIAGAGRRPQASATHSSTAASPSRVLRVAIQLSVRRCYDETDAAAVGRRSACSCCPPSRWLAGCRHDRRGVRGRGRRATATAQPPARRDRLPGPRTCCCAPWLGVLFVATVNRRGALATRRSGERGGWPRIRLIASARDLASRWKQAADGRGDRAGAGLLDAAHRHAHVLAFDAPR